MQSASLGSGEGSGEGEDVRGGNIRGNGDGASEGEIAGLKIFGVSPKLTGLGGA